MAPEGKRDIKVMLSQVHDLVDNPNLAYQEIQGVSVELDPHTKRMTSREIAELTGKRHGNVIRDIEMMAEGLGSDLSFGIKSSTYAHQNGGTRRQYVLDKDSTICLVAGYNVTARMRIIKRWQELEAQDSLPDFTNPAIAARAWADQVEKVAMLEVQVEQL